MDPNRGARGGSTVGGLAIVLIALAALAGCGGDEDDSDAQRQQAAEYVRTLDELCKAESPRLAAIRRELTTTRDAGRARRVSIPKTLERFAVLLRRAHAIGERVIARIRAIDPPESERTFHQALVASVEKASRNLRQQIAAAEAGDAPRLSRLSVEGTVINAERIGLIKGRGGFRFCGRS